MNNSPHHWTSQEIAGFMAETRRKNHGVFIFKSKLSGVTSTGIGSSAKNSQ